MKRILDDKIKEIKDSGKTIYSISRLDTINRCLYEAYRTYVLKDKGDNNIYAALGSRMHDILEGITNGKNTELDLLPAMERELVDVDVFGLEFPKDRNGGDSIRKHWIEDMTHFCNTYKAPKGKKLTAEELFIYETPAGNILQGYIDLQHIRKDGSIDIYDYKTSSIYNGEALKEHSRQLVTYALGKEQEGYKVNYTSFIFLKYAEVSYMGRKTIKSKEDSLLSKCIERYKIASTMSDNVSEKLLKLGYNDIDIDNLLEKFIDANSFNVLPDEVNEQYKIKPYVLTIDLSEESKQETIDYIDSTIKMWEGLSGKEKDYPPKAFTKKIKNGTVTEDTFFCSQLCPHYKKCKYIADYYASKYDKKEEDDLF